MRSARFAFAATLVLSLLAENVWAAQSWEGAQILPKSSRVEIVNDNGSSVSMYNIGWPATVQKTKGRLLWVQDEGGYSSNQAGGWIYSDDVVKLNDAHDYYADQLHAGETAWLDWMCGISWEASGEPDVAILSYQNALTAEPNTRLDDLQIRLGRLLAQQQLRNGRGKYDPAQRVAWESHFQIAQKMNPNRPQLYYEWGLALTHACSCTQSKLLTAGAAADQSNATATSSSEATASSAPDGPTPAGAEAAVQSLTNYQQAERLSPRWWRIPLARAELMLDQCDQESPQGERVVIRNGKPEFFTQLVTHCKRRPVKSEVLGTPETVDAGALQTSSRANAKQKSASSVPTAIPSEMANVLAIAMDDFNRSISLNSNALDAYRDRAEVLRVLNRLGEAQQSATMACKLCYYRQAGSLRTLAQINHDLQQYQPAADYALRAAELTSSDEQQRYLQLWSKCTELSKKDMATTIIVASDKAGYVASRGDDDDTPAKPEKPQQPTHIEPPPGFMSRASSAVPD